VRHLVGIGLGLALWLAPAVACAQGAASGAFRYVAPPSCPNQPLFSEQVASRTPRWLAPRSPFATDIEIVPGASGFVGRVSFEREGRRTVRELRAESCTELVPALALVVAILVDPGLGQAAAPTPPSPEVTEPAPAKAKAPPALWFSVGPELVLQTGETPGLSWGDRAFVGLGRGDGSIFASSLRLSFTRATGHGTSQVSGQRADFERASAGAEGCLLRLARGSLAVEACALLELGRLHAVGLHPEGNVTRDELWATALVGLTPSFTLARRLILSAELGPRVAFTRYRFAFAGENTLYRTPVVAFAGAVGLGVRFP
jgi:hypothetical protein